MTAIGCAPAFAWRRSGLWGEHGGLLRVGLGVRRRERGEWGLGLERSDAAGFVDRRMAVVPGADLEDLERISTGEHVGQLTLALWTLLIATTQSVTALRWLGHLAAGLFVVGLGDGLATVILVPGAEMFAHAPLVAFLTWTVWMVATGIGLIRHARRLLKAQSPSPAQRAQATPAPGRGVIRR